MAKILNIDDMLEIASEIPLPDYEDHKAAIEMAATALARALAKHYGISTTFADFQGKAFAGTCAPFWGRYDGQPCPEPIDEADEGGDWEEFNPKES